MSSPLDQQIDSLCSAALELQARTGDDPAERDIIADTVRRLQSAIGRAVTARDSGATAEISIEDGDLTNAIEQHRETTSRREFQRAANQLLADAATKAGARPGAGDYFADRIVDVGGVPHLKLRAGGTAPITAATVAAELPPSLLLDKHARRADSLDDLREQILEKEREVAEKKQAAAQSRGYGPLVSQASRAIKELAALRDQRDALKQERRDELSLPAPTRAPSPAELGRLESLRQRAEQLRARVHSARGDTRAMAAASAAQREFSQYKREIGA